ncbi:hypothetical protein CMT52_20775 [Elizabethkingia anophelis]|uniref:hypothetical protein n=1 Tax=Elizabethkingia anophelis TaxID=1117645 RepID=UPI000D04315A|nr:hypothetical protein [Elizabethkingia anophelis]MDV3928783.1 hypothetical protein [Elizabethkingia anophelis]MDV4026762.1 hypothetical protein [Elizabethkingia anophelis]PRQ80402.1 hypothetical protein CMT60_09390 [Elizabethkingia anophelis]
MDLFENYELIPEELKAVCDKWQQKAMYEGLDYNDCAIFQEECEAIGYTFDYGLDADPFDLRAIDPKEQKLENQTINNQKNMELVNDLSWYDKNITPITRAYKNFVKEMKNMSPEHFFQDGERVFTEKEAQFLKIFAYKEAKNKISISYSERNEEKFTSLRSSEPISESFKNIESTRNIDSIDKDIMQKNIDIVEDKRSGLEKLADMLDRHYEDEGESMFIFKHPQSIKTLELALFLQNADEALKEEIISYIFLDPPREPDRYNFVDDSYDRGESYYLEAKAEYEVDRRKYDLLIEKAYSVFDQHDFDIHMIHESNAENSPEAFKILLYDLSNRFSLETKTLIENNNVEGSNMRTAEKTPSLYREEYNPYVDDTIEGYSSSELINLPMHYLEHLLELKIKQFGREEKEDDIIAMSFIDSQIKRLQILINNQSIYYNQTSNIMETQKEFNQVQYLKDQMKYLGFGEGEKLHKDLEKGIKSKKNEFEIKASSDKALPGNKVDFILKFNKTESGGVFLNSYHSKLTNDKNEEMSHNFPVNRENTFTAKEAVNLLEGRSVKIEFLNPKTDQKEPAFVRFDFSEPKTEKGNYKFQNFYKNYGIDTAEIVEKSNVVFDKPEYKDSTIKSLEKGNIVKVKIKENDQVVEAKAVLNPQYKNLNLYDQDMTRINTNKPLQGMEDEKGHDKANVKEQSIKR